MPWQHEQLSVTVQTITLWLYCSPGDEFHHELIWDQFSTPKTKPLPLQVLVSDQWQSTTSFMTPAATNTSLPPKISHFPATKRQESRSAWQAKKLQDLKIKPLHRKPCRLRRKIAHFLSSSALCAAGVVILGFGMSTDWADAILDCAPPGSEVFSGTSSLKTGLFNGTETKIRCPRIDSPGKTVSGKLQIRLQLIFYMLDYAILHYICLHIIYCLF